jgi:hypothetical protein
MTFYYMYRDNNEEVWICAEGSGKEKPLLVSIDEFKAIKLLWVYMGYNYFQVQKEETQSVLFELN